MSDADEIAGLRWTVEQSERRVAALEGRVASVAAAVNGTDRAVQRLTALVTESLEFTAGYVAEVRKSLSSTEEHLTATRRAVEVMTEQQGRMLRELAELKKG